MKAVVFFCLAALLDFIIGDPAALPHPIIYIGKLIKSVERGLRKIGLDNRIGGLLLWLVVNGVVTALITFVLGMASLIHPFVKDGLTIYLLFASLAATCLAREVKKVVNALENDGIEEGRKFLSYLVGRDTGSLTEEEVIKATIETTAENTIDGILAPLFYMAIGFIIGYPVQMVFLYKTVNTLDSMVGYIQEPYTRIGYASAKIDDLFNLLPARIGSFLMLLSGFFIKVKGIKAMKIWWRDRYNHKSPNAGFPEAAVAGLLGIQLGGTHTYFGQVLRKPTIGDALREVKCEDVNKTVVIMYIGEVMMVLLMVLLMRCFG